MKAVLKFELPEEKYDFQSAVKGAAWKGLVNDLDENLRQE